jgi:hypothetical protein
MMRKTSALILTVLFVAAMPRVAAASSTVSVKDLLDDAASLDGQTITVVGELIGDYGFRQDGSTWSQLNDDSYAAGPLLEGGNLTGANTGIGIRAPESLVESLDQPGGYLVRGPIVRATGTWKYHDEDRSGETYLDVATIEVVERGRRMSESADPIVIVVGASLLVSTLWLGYRTRQRSAD